VKIICSTVVRAAKQGGMHGGLYVIDVDSGKVIHHASYEKDFIMTVLSFLTLVVLLN
jgi:hypothetical protein